MLCMLTPKTGQSQLGRAFNKEQRSAAYFDMVRHDKVSAAMKEGMQLFGEVVGAVSEWVSDGCKASQKRPAEAAHMAAKLSPC